MKEFDEVGKVTAPYYEQFNKLGELYDIESIDYSFLKAARQFFAKYYFFELKLIFKSGKRRIKREFKDVKRKELADIKAKAKADYKAMQEEHKAKRAEHKHKHPNKANKPHSPK